MPTTLKVAIQGDPASFHEIAAKKYYQQPIELLYCQTFQDTFNQLTNGTADRAFVATSNSAHGEITEVSSLLQQTQLYTEGYYTLPIEQHLIGLPGTSIANLTTVISHPVALSQCDSYLTTTLAHTQLQTYYDTSAAIEYVKKSANASIAAVGSDAAAQLHGLEILQSSIHNDPHNSTVFGSFKSQ
ncbi:MAG: prephenate dehydratase domain-containing protein [Candidatus Microsaccharimonas sp.]